MIDRSEFLHWKENKITKLFLTAVTGLKDHHLTAAMDGREDPEYVKLHATLASAFREIEELTFEDINQRGE